MVPPPFAHNKILSTSSQVALENKNASDGQATTAGQLGIKSKYPTDLLVHIIL